MAFFRRPGGLSSDDLHWVDRQTSSMAGSWDVRSWTAVVFKRPVQATGATRYRGANDCGPSVAGAPAASTNVGSWPAARCRERPVRGTWPECSAARGAPDLPGTPHSWRSAVCQQRVTLGSTACRRVESAIPCKSASRPVHAITGKQDLNAKAVSAPMGFSLVQASTNRRSR